jgi:hypothetical protein
MTYQPPLNANTDLVLEIPGRGEVRLELKWRVIRDRPEVISLSITSLDGDTPLEPVLLREIPLARIIRNERSNLRPSNKKVSNATPRARGTREILTEADLKDVAELYMSAWEQGLPVQRHVAERRGIALSTAARQILLARQRGFINKDINPPRRKK